MMIAAGGAVLNVTYVDRILIDHRDDKWVCFMSYEDGKGKATTFTWTGEKDSPKHSLEIQKELLKQIKEVELEKMSTLLEDAITKV